MGDPSIRVAHFSLLLSPHLAVSGELAIFANHIRLYECN